MNHSDTTGDSPAAHDGTTINRPNPPITNRVPAPGHAAQDAEQWARADITGGAITSETVDSLDTELPTATMIAMEGEVEAAEIPNEKAVAAAIEARIEADILDGRTTGAYPGTTVSTYEAITAMLDAAEETRRMLVDAHHRVVGVLGGETRSWDGASRTGTPISPQTTNIRRTLRLHRLRLLAILLFPAICEAIAIFHTMRAYLRTSDMDIFGPAAISASALLALAGCPVILGIFINDRIHGVTGCTRPWRVIVAGLVTTFWVVSGVVIAYTRVMVDADNAMRKARETQQIAAGWSTGLGSAAGGSAPGSDVSFPVAFSTVMWIAILLSMGVVVLAYEALSRNPVLEEELSLRAAVETATEKCHRLLNHRSTMDTALTAQQVSYDAVMVGWDHRESVIRAATAQRIAIYKRYLVTTSADPEMAAALADHAGRIGRSDDRSVAVLSPIFGPDQVIDSSAA